MFRLNFFTFCLFLTINTIAQPVADTASVASATARLRAKYYEQHRSESFIAMGSDYSEYKSIEDEHPYFKSNDWMMGSLNYNGVTYENVPLQYDARLQKLLTEHPASGKKIELVKEHVAWFKLENHHFANLSKSNPKGFYELMADGDAKLWAAHSKTFQESTVTGRVTVRTEEQTKYFIERDNKLFPVKGKSGVLQAFDDKRTVLQQELKKHRVNFNRNKPAGLIEAVRLYNAIP